MKHHPAEAVADVLLLEHASQVVYVLRAGDRVKIGHTLDLARRVSELQVGCPDQLEVLLAIPGDPSDESYLHERFAAQWVRGEWYRLDETISAWIEAARETRSVR